MANGFLTVNDGSIWLIDPSNPGNTTAPFGQQNHRTLSTDNNRGITIIGNDVWVLGRNGTLDKLNGLNLNDSSSTYGLQTTVTGPNIPNGLTNDGTNLIIVDTRSRLWSVNPTTFAVTDLGALPVEGHGIVYFRDEYWIISGFRNEEIWRINPDNISQETNGYGQQTGDIVSVGDMEALAAFNDDLYTFERFGDTTASRLLKINPDNISQVDSGYGNQGNTPASAGVIDGAVYSTLALVPPPPPPDAPGTITTSSTQTSVTGTITAVDGATSYD